MPSTVLTTINLLQRTGMRNNIQKMLSQAAAYADKLLHMNWIAGAVLLVCGAAVQAATPPVVVITAPATTVTRSVGFTYNADGLLDVETREPDNAQLKLQTSYKYDAWGNRTETQISSPASGMAAIVTAGSSVSYDGRGQFPSTQKNALGHGSSAAYDARYGAVSRVDDVNQLVKQFTYDDFGRKVLEINPDGTRMQWTYSLCDVNCKRGASYFVNMSVYANDGTTQIAPSQKIYFDTLDRDILSETQGFDGRTIYREKEYDSRGNLARSSRPYFANGTVYWTSFIYDEFNRLVSSTAPDAAVVSFTYNGLRSSTTNALNQTTTKVLDAKGQQAEVIDPLNQAISYQYDAFGNLWLTTDPKGNMNVMAHDILGNKVKMYEPDTGGTIYEYDALGRLVGQTDSRGNVTVNTYDVLNRMTQRKEVDLVSSWEFDTCARGVGKLCKMWADNGYSNVLAYDTYGRIGSGSTTIDAIYTTSTTFDEWGRAATHTYPTGLVLEYVYQGFTYAKEIRNKASGALFWRAKDVDAEGRLLEQMYGNQVVTNAVYDNANGEIKEQYAGAGKGVQNLVYGFDKIGNLQSRSDGNQNLSETFLYDGLNRLKTATVNSSAAGLVTQSYDYDEIGNIKQRSGVGTYGYLETSGKPHAVSSILLDGGGKRHYTYDATGNLTSELQTLANGATVAAKGRTLSYTSFNMPVTIATSSTSMTFLYGPQHQRIKGIAPGLTTVYLNGSDSGSLLYEKDVKANGEVEHRQFISANGMVVAVVKTVGSQSNTQYFHRDYLGSVVAVSDEAGTVIERFAYDASGKRRFPAGGQDQQDTLAGTNTKRGFTNHEHLDALGLIHMNGRVYDPMVARFMTADTGVPHPDDLQSYNRYAYARNNPLLNIDLNGFQDNKGDTRLKGLGESCGACQTIADFENQMFNMNANRFTPLFAADNSLTLVSVINNKSLKNSTKNAVEKEETYSRVSFFSITGPANDGSDVTIFRDTWRKDPRIYGTPDQVMQQWFEFDLFTSLLRETGLSPKASAVIGNLLGMVGNPKAMVANGLAKLAERKAGRVFYHYTDEASAKLIKESGKLLPNKKNQVFLTMEKIAPDDANSTLFIGLGGSKGSHVVELQVKDGLHIEKGKNTNEYIHYGTIRDGRQADMNVKPNDF